MFIFFKQKTAYEMRISDWSSDVCSSDLKTPGAKRRRFPVIFGKANVVEQRINPDFRKAAEIQFLQIGRGWLHDHLILVIMLQAIGIFAIASIGRAAAWLDIGAVPFVRSEEHTSELQSLMRISYAVFC